MDQDDHVMALYVGIDQHRKQLTVSVAWDESGNVLVRRQVSTAWQKVLGVLR